MGIIELVKEFDKQVQQEIGIERGIEIGIERGMEKGIERGIEKGIEKGELKMLTKSIVSMHKKGLDTPIIADLLETSEGFVQKTINETKGEQETVKN